MNINELISVCIPTFNRSQSLKETLQDLIPKAKKHNIAIYVSDNGSTDDTRQIVLQLKKEYELIFYTASEHEPTDADISSERNMLNALRSAKSKYRLLLGDHYIIYDDNVFDNLLRIAQDDFDAIVVHHNRRIMPRQSDYVYTDPSLALKELAWYMPMVSTTLYRDELVQNAPFHKWGYTGFGHALVVFDYMANKGEGKIYYCSKTSTWTTKGGVKGSRSWHDLALDIFTTQWFNAVMSLDNFYSYEDKLDCARNHPKYNPPFYSLQSLIFYRFCGGLSFAKIYKNFKPFYMVAGFKVVTTAFFVAFMPRSYIKYIAPKSYEYIKRVLAGVSKFQDRLK